MLAEAAEKITEWLIENEAIESEERELYEYAAFNTLHTIVPLFMIMGLGSVMGLFIESIFLILPFMVIRKYSGGFHADSQLKCTIYSLMLQLGFLLFCYDIKVDSLNVIIIIISSVGLYLFSPIDSANRRLDEVDIKRCKRMARIIVSVILLLYLTLYVCGKSHLAACISLGIGMCEFLQFPVAIERIIKNV